MIFWFLLLQLSLVVSAAEAPFSEVGGATFSEWISLLVSRGVYFLLAFLIALCFVITTVKNKIEERTQALDSSTSNDRIWSTSYWKGSNPEFTLPGSRDGQSEMLPLDDVEAMKDRLREAEVTVTSLKAELDHANKSRIDLENTLESIERDKIGSEDELLRLKVDVALELEALRKESALTERQLKIALEEKEDLNREVECLKREGRITESALKDQQNLTERLENARQEIESLKNQMKGMKAERNMAVRLATDLMEKAKGIASRDTEQRQLIEEMIDAELKRVREDEEEENKLNQMNEMNEETTQIDYNLSCTTGNSDGEERPGEIPERSGSGECIGECIGPECVLHNDFGSLRMAVGDAPLSICRTVNDIYIATQGIEEQVMESRTSSDGSESSHSSAEDDAGSNTSRKRLVTGSPAFRAFLNSLGQRDG